MQERRLGRTAYGLNGTGSEHIGSQAWLSTMVTADQRAISNPMSDPEGGSLNSIEPRQ